MARKKDIRDEYFRKGKSISDIAQELHIDRKTVRKYIEEDDWNEQLPEMNRDRGSLLDPYKPLIKQWMLDDKKRRRKQRHTAKRIYARLVQEENYTGSYRTVAAFVSEVRKTIYQEVNPALPLKHHPGEAQVDFGEADYYENGRLIHGSFLILSFPSSNAGFAQLTAGQNSECLFEALIAIFIFLGGVPGRLWFDNASSMVSKVLKGGARELTERFLRFQEHFGFEAAFCNPASGNEKGNVENKVGYIRRNYFVPEPVFFSLDEYNQGLLEVCRQDLEREHYRRDNTISDLLLSDMDALLPLPRIAFDPARYVTKSVDAYGMVSLQGGKHQYSTSPRYAGSTVRLKIGSQLVTVLDDSLRPVVQHRRLYGDKKQEQMDWIPYLTQLSRRPGALKYTAVYEMLPDPLQLWINSQSKKSVGKAIGVLATLTSANGFEKACEAVSNSIACGINDVDSLVAIHDSLTKVLPFMPALNLKDQIQTPPLKTEPARYDSMLRRASR